MPRTTGSSELHQLIHSLTPAEKGYFQKYANRHSENTDYLTLFRAINEMEVYTETALKKKFKSLPVLKNYLFELIMESLAISETEPPVANTILTGIVKINLLLKKGLRQKALKLLTDYKIEAQKAEQYHLLAYLLKIELNTTYSSWLPKERLQRVKETTNAIRDASLKQLNADDFRYQELIDHSIGLVERNTGVMPPVDDWMDKDFISSPDNALTSMAEGSRLFALAGYYESKGDTTQMYSAIRDLYLFQKNKWQKGKKHNRPEIYLNALNRYISAAIIMKDIPLAESLTEELRTVPLKMQGSIIENDLRYIFNRQNVLWAKGTHKEGAEFSKKALEKSADAFKMPHYTSKMLKLVGIKSLFEFSTGEYDKAINTLQFFNPGKLGNYSETDKKSAEFILLLIQFNLGNYDLIKSMIRSIKVRYKSLSKAEQNFLMVFLKYYNQSATLYSYLKKHCGSIELFQTFELKDWVESKIARKEFSEVIRKNNMLRS